MAENETKEDEVTPAPAAAEEETTSQEEAAPQEDTATAVAESSADAQGDEATEGDADTSEEGSAEAVEEGPLVAPAPRADFTPPAESIGTGRRKSSVARVRVRPGSGSLTINGRPLEDFFQLDRDQKDVIAPLEDSGRRGDIDVIIRVNGGGTTGQSGACRMGVARALVQYDHDLYHVLREHGHMTRDSRMKERKKPGLHGARRGTQFSKR